MTEELKEQIRMLMDVHAGMQRVRKIPPGILQSFQKMNGVWEEFAILKGMGETVKSEGVQTALHRARESMKADAGDLGGEARRETRKRRRQMRPGTPEPESEEIFLMKETKEKGVKMLDMGNWAHEYNKLNANKIRIRGRLLRYTIPDVMTVYMGIGGEDEVVVETIRVFGPREQKGCHEQSSYGIYQQITQQLGRVLSKTSLDGLMPLLCSYEGLFISQCVVCGRVVSGDGHVPPVVRWRAGQDWAARHVGCVIGGAIG